MHHEQLTPDAIPVTAEAWYAALDHRWIESRGLSWVTEVTGVHTDGADWWIQLTPVGEPEKGLVLHLSGPATVGHALEALHRHVPGALLSRQVVHVRRAA